MGIEKRRLCNCLQYRYKGLKKNPRIGWSFISSIFENNSITYVQKFHYLQSSLQGKAVEKIQSINFSTKNYIV